MKKENLRTLQPRSGPPFPSPSRGKHAALSVAIKEVEAFYVQAKCNMLGFTTTGAGSVRTA
jgi:hypothetical protein